MISTGHYILPSLNAFIGFEELDFLKTIKFDQWDLVLCTLDYYATGMNRMYTAYWVSYISTLNMEMEDAENYATARKLYNNLNDIRARCDVLYSYIRDSLCALLISQGISAKAFSNITGISSGCNYFRIEVGNGSI